MAAEPYARHIALSERARSLGELEFVFDTDLDTTELELLEDFGWK
jgi:hypothetical protein